MNPIKNILSKITGDAVDKVGKVIDTITTTDEEKLSKKAEISQIVLNALSASEAVQAEVIKTEMKGESWLQRNWRPIVMLTFAGLLVIRWTGVSSFHIALELEMGLLEIVKLGLSGYVVGRSVEKTAGVITENIDMSFLKKKKRYG